MEQTKMELMHEVLINRYILGYLAVRKELSEKLHELGYYDCETGQATSLTQNYFDELFLDYKEQIVRELRRSKKERIGITYNQLSVRLGFAKETFYLHHFLKKLHREKLIVYEETDYSDSKLRYLIN